MSFRQTGWISWPDHVERFGRLVPGGKGKAVEFLMLSILCEGLKTLTNSANSGQYAQRMQFSKEICWLG